MLNAIRLLRPAAKVYCRSRSICSFCGANVLLRKLGDTAALTPLYNLQISRFNGDIHNEKRSNDNMLDKHMATITSDIHKKFRIYKTDLFLAMNKIKENKHSSQSQGILLLSCCSDLLPDESPSSRLSIAHQIWKALKSHTTFTTEHYNELLRCYINNGQPVNAADFLSKMSPVKPNETTYELILESLCEAGNLNQAAEVISNMKSIGIPASEKTFYLLIIGEGRAGKLEKIEEILEMMKALRIEKSKNTHLAIAKAHLLNKDYEVAFKELSTAIDSGFLFDEAQIMELVKYAALQGLCDIFPELLKFAPEKCLSSPSITPYMQRVCTELVYLDCSHAALQIYNCLPLPAFGPSDDLGLHGRSLVRDCIKAGLSSGTVTSIAEDLMKTGRNPLALQCAAEAALQQARVPLALELFAAMLQRGLPVRPHYYWPILIAYSKSHGEKGILNALTTMVQMEVRPDYDTLLDYALPYVSFSSPQNLMRKLLDCGLTVTETLTPMMTILMSSGQIRAASELCEIFKGKVDSEALISPLMKGFLSSGDIESTIYVLEEMATKSAEKGNDWIGSFLYKLAVNKKIKFNFQAHADLVKALKDTTLKISPSAQDAILSHVTPVAGARHEELFAEFKMNLESITDERMVEESELFLQHIPHPRCMNEPTLRSHLTELESQGMNTRGVLRKLLQRCCREGKLKEAQQVLEKCRQEEVNLSAGMKASVIDMYVKLEQLELAEAALADLNKTFPNFALDEFKLIDFATLNVRRNKINRAFDLIEQFSQKRQVMGGRTIELNCWKLLNTIAATAKPKQVQQMYNLLVKSKFCRPSNVILGPLIRVHLNMADLETAVSEFSRLALAHRCTPLKHELLCQVLTKAGPEQDPKSHQMVATILKADGRVHGGASAQLTLASALAEVGHKKSLRRIFLEPKSSLDPRALLAQCQRFADEKKLAPVEAIAECVRDVRNIDRDAIFDVMLQVYQRSNDYHGALSLWYKMAEEEVRPHTKFATNLASLLRANRQPVPPEIAARCSATVQASA